MRSLIYKLLYAQYEATILFRNKKPFFYKGTWSFQSWLLLLFVNLAYHYQP